MLVDQVGWGTWAGVSVSQMTSYLPSSVAAVSTVLGMRKGEGNTGLESGCVEWKNSELHEGQVPLVTEISGFVILRSL